MSDDIKRVRFDFPRLLLEELVSVQPMTGSTDLFDITAFVPAEGGWTHTPNDGTFCGCWGRCFVCEPLSDDEKRAQEEP